jgi:DNA-binding transcriptional MerR regulator
MTPPLGKTSAPPDAADAAAEPEPLWPIGQLAAELAVTPRTLRFYEAQGLIAPLRSSGGRRYTRRDRARMQLILRGKRFGMSLGEIAEILDMYDGAGTSKIRQLERVLARVGEITDELSARQRDIDNTLSELSEVSDRCRARLEQLRDTGGDDA